MGQGEAALVADPFVELGASVVDQIAVHARSERKEDAQEEASAVNPASEGAVHAAVAQEAVAEVWVAQILRAFLIRPLPCRGQTSGMKVV